LEREQEREAPEEDFMRNWLSTSTLGFLFAVPVTAATSLSVTSGAALQGSFGLQVNFDGAGGNAYVQDNSPNNEAEYWASLRINDTGVTFQTGGNFQIFRAFTDDAGSQTVFRVTLLEASTPGGNYRIRVLPRLDSGAFHPTGYEVAVQTSTPPPANQRFTFEWKAATAPGANNGRMVTYRDGVLRKQITDLDNDTLRVGMIRMGGFGNTTSVQAGSVLYLDDFVSTRTNHLP
jgi:hypothetical protein